jgi:group I intron endonuclease
MTYGTINADIHADSLGNKFAPSSAVFKNRIYLVTNTINGKQYVGQTVTKHSRKGHGHALADAYKKYGHKSFTYETICQNIDNPNTLDFAERFWINVMGSLAPNGYNLENGGRRYKTISNKPQLGIPHSEETKIKMSEGQKRYLLGIETHFNKGRKHSEETKAKMRQARANRIYTDEDKQKISEAVTAWHKQRKEKA